MTLTARRVAGLAATFAIPLFALLPGCSRHLTQALVPNQKPQIELIDARVDVASRTDVRIKWAARDPDGEVSRTCWTLTPMHAATMLATAVPSATKASECVLPNRASVGPKRAGVQRPDPEILTLWAIDDAGAPSDPIRLGLVGNNVAPIVVLTCPVPNAIIQTALPPNVTFAWAGTDPDGQTTQHPVQYKYKLLVRGNPEFDIDYARTANGPDSLRNYFAARNWEGWTTVGGDTTSASYASLTIGADYLFVVTAFDEVGDYDPVFGLSKNMLYFNVGYPATLGPRLRLWNSEFDYAYSTGGIATDPAGVVRVEEPADAPLTFNWLATPREGGDVLGYRWALDMADPNDPTTRSDPNDLAHWSAWSTDLSATLGPFPSRGIKRVAHRLYVEASAAAGGCVLPPQDGSISRGIVQFTVVRPTWQSEVLIVDDTRLEVSKFAAGSTTRLQYSGVWPAAAELDTFLYAVGGVPWMDALGTSKPNTAPGLFHGYPFDTLGSRGLTSGGGAGMGSVPLSSLTDYRHVIWIVDHFGGTNTASLTNLIAPMGALSYASTPGHLNALAEYAAMGGKVWVMGGAAGNAMTRAYDAIGIDDNNAIYGPANARIYAGPGYAIHPGKEELTPGRFMFDRSAWRSMFAFQTIVTRFVRSPRATAAPNWTQQPGYGYANPVTRPDYTLLPDQMHLRTNPATDPVNGDALPPTRPSNYATQWWSTSPTTDAEYLLQPNTILEDMDPDPVHVELQAALDTLMSAQSVNLLNTGSAYEPASMTWYHGVESPELVFTGFPIWSWRRSDGQKVVDFVMQQIWHIGKTSPGRPQQIADRRLAPAASPATSPRASALPVRRSVQR